MGQLGLLLTWLLLTGREHSRVAFDPFDLREKLDAGENYDHLRDFRGDLPPQRDP